MCLVWEAIEFLPSVVLICRVLEQMAENVSLRCGQNIPGKSQFVVRSLPSEDVYRNVAVGQGCGRFHATAA
jgi:hypothetical protein